MPLTIRLEDEKRKVLGEVFDLQNVITRLSNSAVAEELRIAQTIDPYGDTMLNQLQIPALLDDLKTLMVRATKIEEAKTLRDVAALARRSNEEPHLYLWFYGD